VGSDLLRPSTAGCPTSRPVKFLEMWDQIRAQHEPALSEGAGAFRPLNRALQIMAFRPGHSLGQKMTCDHVCYSCYVMLVGSQAEQIRHHLQIEYFSPARRRGEKFVTVRAGDVHRELGLRNRVPNVCQVMESRILEREAGVKVSSKQAPPKGRGTTLTITYTIEPLNPGQNQGQDRSQVPLVSESSSIADLPHDRPANQRLFYELRGLGAETFSALGGGESFLKKERAEFYGKPDLSQA